MAARRRFLLVVASIIAGAGRPLTRTRLAARDPTRPGARDFADAREGNRRNGGVLESPL